MQNSYLEAGHQTRDFLQVCRLSFSAGWIEFKEGNLETVFDCLKTQSVLLVTSEAFVAVLIWISKEILVLFKH